MDTQSYNTDNQVRQINSKGELAMGIFQLVLARIQSETPSFYKRVRKVMAWIVSAQAILIALFQLNVFHLPDATNNAASTVLGFILSACAGVGGATHLGTTDTALMSPESKAAVIEEATIAKSPGQV